MAPMSCTSKWRMPIVRLEASRTSAKTSGRDLVQHAGLDLGVGILADLLDELLEALAQVPVGLLLEGLLEDPDTGHPLLELLELLGLSEAQRAVQDGHAPRVQRAAPPSAQGRYSARLLARPLGLGPGAGGAPASALLAVALDLAAELLLAQVDRMADVV